MGSSTVLGKGKIKLHNAVSTLDESTPVIIELTHHDKTKGDSLQGQVTLQAIVYSDASHVVTAEETSKATAAAVSVGPPVKLVISGIAARNLFDAGSFMDHQDPFVQIKIGSKVFKTTRYICIIH